MDSQPSGEARGVGREGGEGQERRGSIIAQRGKDFLRYVLCGCIGEDQETPVDEHQPLLAGEERTYGEDGSRVEEHTREVTGSEIGGHSIETLDNANNRNKEKLTQNFQAAKTRIDDYLKENPQSLEEEKAEFERISDDLSKWIKHAKEGKEMDCVSRLVKELSEMRLASDFANDLSTMRTRRKDLIIVQLDVRSERIEKSQSRLIENFQTAKTRIDDHLEKNPGFLDQKQREEYKKRVNQFYEDIKRDELKRGREHASHVFDILRKISYIEDFQTAKTRIDDYLEKNPEFLNEGQREEYKKMVGSWPTLVKRRIDGVGGREAGMIHCTFTRMCERVLREK